jgi:3-phosphoshikimate 1-carboxyvinyltransferase
LQDLGVPWTLEGTTLTVEGRDIRPWDSPQIELNCGNSATTLRTLAGALVSTNTPAVLDGSPGLRRRPMGRIIEPLREMGALIHAGEGECAPLTIESRPHDFILQGISYKLRVASAQVKTTILLAALGAQGPTLLHEPGPSRDHTERMLKQMGVDIRQDLETGVLRCNPPMEPLKPLQFSIPGDISSAAFLIVAALISPGSELHLESVELNPTRTGLLDALQKMGADIEIILMGEQAGEPVGDLIVRYGQLKAIEVEGPLVVRMIDEFPIFAVAAAHAEGTTVVREAEELRHKETDRIQVLAEEFQKLGIPIREKEDGFTLTGGVAYDGGEVSARGDHRLGMALSVLGLGAKRALEVKRAEIIHESFPQFISIMQSLGAKIEIIDERG